MRTTLFEWADAQGLTLESLSQKMGYSTRHLRRIRDGEYPITKPFMARVILQLGPWAKCLFSAASVPQRDDSSHSGDSGGLAQPEPGAQP